MTERHIGRSWAGTRLEDDCPCQKAACGLAIRGTADAPDCPQHSSIYGKTRRQGHAAANCPALPLTRTTTDTGVTEWAWTCPVCSGVVTALTTTEADARRMIGHYAPHPHARPNP